ncbi:hypothetical protein Acid7E03_41400 [Acidisoma sp. 7E03]
MLAIVPFTSINDYLPHADAAIDLVVYYVHDSGADPTSEIVNVCRAIPDRRLLIIANLVNADRAALAQHLNGKVVAFLQPQKASLALMVSAFYLTHHERRFTFDDVLTISPHISVSQPRTGTMADVTLTRRERAVLELIRQGQSNREISDSLEMSPSTVKAHVRNIMQKTKATNRTQLALDAERKLRTISF